MEGLTFEEATRRPEPVTLSIGETVEIRKVSLRDLTAVRNLYFGVLGGLAAELGRQPTEAEALEHLPLAIADGHLAGSAWPMELLGALCSITAEQLQGCDLGDVEAVWGAIYRANRYPFERVRREITDKAAGEMKRLIDAENASSSPESSPPASTPEIPDSPPNGPSTSPRGGRSGRSGRGMKTPS